MTDRSIARSLMEIGAVSIRLDPPFTWASGRLSPIYCDNRLLMSYPEHRQAVTEGFIGLTEERGWSIDIVAGTATAGIPHAAWLAGALNLPMVYIRGGAKSHGKGNRVEGLLEPGKSVLLIEDLISTGGSSISAASALIDAGTKLLGVASIFTYELAIADQRFAEAEIPWSSLTSFSVLADEAVSAGTLSRDEKQILADWRTDPAAWSQARGGAG